MEYPAPAKHNNSATTPYRKIEVKNDIENILHLPGGKRIITNSFDGSFRVWDLDTGTQVGEEWEDQERGALAMTLSPGGKTVVSGSRNGMMRLWNVDTGKVDWVHKASGVCVLESRPESEW
jgi:WD40 repeat protein